MRNQIREALLLAAYACAAGGIGGCASIAHGTKQEILFNSTPPSIVKVDGEIKGTTPLTVALRRGEATHWVSFEKTGCTPAHAVIERRFSPWYIADIALPPGFALDAVDGAMWKLVPERVDAALVCPYAGGAWPFEPPDEETLLNPG